MYKKLTIFMICLSLFSSLHAEEEYVFKAKGEFAKELKALMQKYADEGKVEIQEAPKGGTFKTETVGIVDAFLNNEETAGDIAYGKQLYDKTCFVCHGKNADDSKYSNARALTTLDKKTLIEQLENYSTDPEHGGSTKVIMHQAAVGMSTPDIASVSAYIYSLTHDVDSATAPITEEAKSDDESPSTYLQ